VDVIETDFVPEMGSLAAGTDTPKAARFGNIERLISMKKMGVSGACVMDQRKSLIKDIASNL
jgi:hypothetical protein